MKTKTTIEITTVTKNKIKTIIETTIEKTLILKDKKEIISYLITIWDNILHNQILIYH